MACHVIDVGIYFPNLFKERWAGSSVVKRMPIVTAKVGGSSLQNNKFFLHQIKLNWHGWSPRRVHEHSMSSTVHGVPMDSMDSMCRAHGVLMECPWSAHGLLIDSM